MGRHGNGTGAAWARHGMCEFALKRHGHVMAMKKKFYGNNL
jgi:hypothetical protein